MKLTLYAPSQPMFGVSNIGLIDQRNYAVDPAIVERVVTEVIPKQKQIEAQRLTLENDWLKFYKVWACEHESQNKTYRGMNDVYVPETYTLTETAVDHIKQEIFPFKGNIAVRPRPLSDPMSPMYVMPVQELMLYDISQARLRSHVDVALRNSIIYGWTPIKCAWRVEKYTDYSRALAPDPITGAMQVATQPREVIAFEGPTFQPVDPLALYVHPFGCRDTDALEWAHEHVDVDWNFLLSMQAEGIYIGVERLLELQSKGLRTQADENKERRLARLGITKAQISADKNAFTITEIWTKFDLYGDGNLVPTKITLYGDLVLEVRQNPHNDQKMPYIFHRDADVGETFYGRSRIKSVAHLQFTLNGVVNQGLDSNAYANNNMIIIDMSRFQGRMADIEVGPLMIFPMNGDASEKAIRFVAPPNTIAQAIATAQAIGQSMKDAFRLSAALQGQVSDEAKTATEVQTAAMGALTGISSTSNNVENNLMSAWLNKAWKLEQQFRLPTSPPRAGVPMLPPEAFVPDYSMEFLVGQAAQQYGQEMAAQMQMAQGGVEGAPYGSAHPGAQGSQEAVSSNDNEGNIK